MTALLYLSLNLSCSTPGMRLQRWLPFGSWRLSFFCFCLYSFILYVSYPQQHVYISPYVSALYTWYLRNTIFEYFFHWMLCLLDASASLPVVEGCVFFLLLGRLLLWDAYVLLFIHSPVHGHSHFFLFYFIIFLLHLERAKVLGPGIHPAPQQPHEPEHSSDDPWSLTCWATRDLP